MWDNEVLEFDKAIVMLSRTKSAHVLCWKILFGQANHGLDTSILSEDSKYIRSFEGASQISGMCEPSL